MHSFETVTLAPIDQRLIDPLLMTPTEIAWLDTYHQRVFGALSGWKSITSRRAEVAGGSLPAPRRLAIVRVSSRLPHHRQCRGLRLLDTARQALGEGFENLQALQHCHTIGADRLDQGF